MHLYSADRAEDLVGKLAEVLQADPLDPMQPEWLAVPSDGMRRWVLLELARHLGASRPGGGDGIAANFVRAYPGTLRSIVLDATGAVRDFAMNDRCAAGCGRYLGYIADEMNMGLHELGPLAMKSTKAIRINSTCTVFAGAELRDRLSLGDKREDIMAGLHRAIMLRAMSILARSGGVRDQFTFTGGVAKNEAAVKSLKELIKDNYGEVTLNIDPDSIYTGALGGATFAWRAVVEEGKAIEARA